MEVFVAAIMLGLPQDVVHRFDCTLGGSDCLFKRLDEAIIEMLVLRISPCPPCCYP
jgi:hypothetical protein